MPSLHRCAVPGHDNQGKLARVLMSMKELVDMTCTTAGPLFDDPKECIEGDTVSSTAAAAPKPMEPKPQKRLTDRAKPDTARSPWPKARASHDEDDAVWE